MSAATTQLQQANLLLNGIHTAETEASKMIRGLYAPEPPFVFSDKRFGDNRPFRSASQMGRNASAASFYYLNEPSERELQITARRSPIGFRLVYEIAADIWNNNFKVEINSLDDPSEQKEFNEDFNQYMIGIHFWEEVEKATAFDREQGESLLFIHREGMEYNKLYEPADPKIPVSRVEAVNKVDYHVQNIKEQGTATEYHISFYRSNKDDSAAGKITYRVHPSHAVRFRTRNIDYDQYKGQSALRAIFSTLQILLNIERAFGDAAYRWALGLPAIFTKGLRNEDALTKAKEMIGDPTSQSWMLFPSELIEKVEMLGIKGQMMDLAGFQEALIGLIIANTGIPKPVLLGEVAGVVTGSEVNERSYYAYLDRRHTELEHFIREYFDLDPFVMTLINSRDYKINWGLRQVMTLQAEAEFKGRIFQNAFTLLNFCTLDEARIYAGFPPIGNAPGMTPELCEQIYGITVEELGILIPNMGQWRQAVAREIIETPVEREAARQNTIHGGEGGNQTQGESGTDNKVKQQEREHAKRERIKDLDISERLKTLLPQALSDEQLEKIMNNVIEERIRNKDNIVGDVLFEKPVDRARAVMQAAFTKARKLVSLNDMEAVLGTSKSTNQSQINFLGGLLQKI